MSDIADFLDEQERQLAAYRAAISASEKLVQQQNTLIANLQTELAQAQDAHMAQRRCIEKLETALAARKEVCDLLEKVTKAQQQHGRRRG